ncbi:hypothetical protein HF847_07405 [Clostridium cochlearium]|uniref:hypothetical protein n=1 Tax=Clostridium cochlearium TaxID=1494 RepID=UPI001459DA8C|nr:hypothetical protein [Clostridium cochlearium]NME95820.1 hypothetical protein [Clostridium cochlearium]
MKNKIKIDKLLVRQEENCDPIEVDPCDPVNIDSCNTCTKIDLGDIDLTNPGLLIDVSATIRNVCPNRLISVACILCEEVEDEDVVRAVQVLEDTAECPEGEECFCTDLDVDFTFAVEQACDSEGDDRVFKARIIAHYLNPECCECNCPEDNNDVEA